MGDYLTSFVSTCLNQYTYASVFSAPSVATAFINYDCAMDNPVIQPILALLRDNPAGTSEYALHRALAGHEAFSHIGEGQLALFRKHFLVMNALYQLQQQCWDESRETLSISPLHIQLQTGADSDDSGSLAEFADRAAYYLDWENYRTTSEKDVETLLDGFWLRYYRQENRAEAMKTLELGANATPAEVESRYRRLAAIHHPDRGGDQETFIQIRGAYEQLR